MAKNYSFAEAVKIIAEGKNKTEMADIGKRFPLLAMCIATIAVKAGNDFVEMASFMPEHLTANKVNSAMKAQLGDADVEDEETEEEKPAKVEKAPKAKSEKKAEEADGTDYNAISGSKLFEMIKAAGKLKDLKAKGFGTKKADLVAYLNENPLDAEEAEEETEEAGKYDDMTAMELFKECKKRGIKAEAKKPAKHYISLLEKDDAKAAEEETDAEDDWDDEEPEEKPIKKAEKKKTPAKKAPAKKAEPEPEDEEETEEPDDDEDDDDWDI